MKTRDNGLIKLENDWMARQSCIRDLLWLLLDLDVITLIEIPVAGERVKFDNRIKCDGEV